MGSNPGIQTWPVPIYKPEPPYTDEARRAGLEGTVTMWIVVGADGKVMDAQETSKALGRGLDESALATIRAWKFRPGIRDGKPATVRVLAEITFRLFDHADAGFVPAGKDVIPPQPVYTPNPEYTEEARHARLQGAVTLEIIVDRKGRVTSVEEVGPELGMGLDKKAMKTVRKWKYRPATRNGKSVVARARITVTFNL